MKPETDDLCSWRDLRVVRLGSTRAVSKAKLCEVLVYWRDHGEPPTGYLVEWPTGKKRVQMHGLVGGDE
jgi:hypothetical protein